MKQAEQEFDPWSVFIIIESTYLKFAPLPGMQFSWLWPDSAQPEALISPFILGFIFPLLGIPHTFHHQLRPLLPHIFSSEQSLKSSLCCSQVSRSPIAFGGPSISSCFCPGLCAFSILYIFFENSNPSWIPEHFWASPKSPSTHFLSKVLDHGMQLLFNSFSHADDPVPGDLCLGRNSVFVSSLHHRLKLLSLLWFSTLFLMPFLD